MAPAVELVALGILYLVVAAGLWRGRKWAWTLALASYAVGIIVTHVQNIISPISNWPGDADAIIFGAIIVYYFTRRHVRAFFDRGETIIPRGESSGGELEQ